MVSSVLLEAHMKPTIGEPADRFGPTTHVLRRWESVDLLHPRRAADHHHTTADLTRLRELLTTDNPWTTPTSCADTSPTSSSASSPPARRKS
ncbi:MAG: MerR family transcriptional regulator [Nocardioides sp.]